MKVNKYVTDIINKKYFSEHDVKTYSYNNEENFIINVHPEVEYQDWLVRSTPELG